MDIVKRRVAEVRTGDHMVAFGPMGQPVAMLIDRAWVETDGKFYLYTEKIDVVHVFPADGNEELLILPTSQQEPVQSTVIEKVERP